MLWKSLPTEAESCGLVLLCWCEVADNAGLLGAGVGNDTYCCGAHTLAAIEDILDFSQLDAHATHLDLHVQTEESDQQSAAVSRSTQVKNCIALIVISKHVSLLDTALASGTCAELTSSEGGQHLEKAIGVILMQLSTE